MPRNVCRVYECSTLDIPAQNLLFHLSGTEFEQRMHSFEGLGEKRADNQERAKDSRWNGFKQPSEQSGTGF